MKVIHNRAPKTRCRRVEFVTTSCKITLKIVVLPLVARQRVNSLIGKENSDLLLLFIALCDRSMGSSMKDVCVLGEGRGLAKMLKKWTGEGGGLAVSGHHFQCGLCKRYEGI